MHQPSLGIVAIRIGRTIIATSVVITALTPALTGCSSQATSHPQLPQSPSKASPSPMALASYRQLLRQIDTTLATDMQQLGSARTPGAVSNAATALGNTLSHDASLLNDVTAPAPLRSAQAALMSALNDFSSNLQDTISAAGADQVCAGPSAITTISRDPGVAELRSAAAQLAAADRAGTRIGSFLPQVAADLNRRLTNGILVKAPAPAGAGQLTVDNSQNSTDAAVSLVLGGSHTPAMTVYVRAGSSATANGIADGSYQVYVTTGTDWDKHLRLFTRDCDFQQFDQPVSFTTTATQYTTEQLTLYGVSNGNVSESSVSPDQFPA